MANDGLWLAPNCLRVANPSNRRRQQTNEQTEEQTISHALKVHPPLPTHPAMALETRPR